MLEVGDRPPNDDQTSIARLVAQLESPWDRAAVTQILKSWVQSLPCMGDAEYSDSLNLPTNCRATPQMAFAPLLILRKRGTRTMLDALVKIATQLEANGELTDGILAICGDDDDQHEARHRDEQYNAGIHDELLFPLPSNDQQGEIVRRLGQRPAVLVQGPPGTGKSHTIVNLICHFLADGKRVLVTSQTPRALTVLRDKIGKDLEEILPLVVSILGENAESLQNLEQSVQGILYRVSHWDEADIQQTLNQRTRQRQSAKAELAAAQRRLRELREAETQSFVVTGTTYHGTAQSIARRHVDDAAACNWIPDSIDEDQAPPLNDDEFAELCWLWGTCNFDLLKYSFPLPENLPSIEAVADAAASHSTAEMNLEQAGGPPSGTQRCFLTLEESKLAALWEAAEKFIRLAETLQRLKVPWTERVWSDVANGRGMWTELARITGAALATLAEIAEFEGDNRLEIPEGISNTQVSADANELLAHLKSGRGFGFWVFRASVVKQTRYLWQETRFRGQRCNSADVLRALIRFLKAEELLERTYREWSGWLKFPPGTLSKRQSVLKSCYDVLGKAIDLGTRTTDMMALGAPASGIDGAKPIVWGQPILKDVKAAQATLALQKSVDVLSDFSRRIEGLPYRLERHSVVDDLTSAIRKRDVAAYRLTLERVANLRNEQDSAARCAFSGIAPGRRARVDETVGRAPRFARRGDSPKNFQRAWEWRRAKSWLSRYLTEHAEDGVVEKIARAEYNIQQATESLVAIKAWKKCTETIKRNPQLNGALRAWVHTVRDLGAGPGGTRRHIVGRHASTCRNVVMQFQFGLCRSIALPSKWKWSRGHSTSP